MLGCRLPTIGIKCVWTHLVPWTAGSFQEGSGHMARKTISQGKVSVTELTDFKCFSFPFLKMYILTCQGTQCAKISNASVGFS